jgi:predicted phosphoribosyltransferase
MFSTREHAGRELAQLLSDNSVSADLVLGLPRGGVIVAAEVARILGLPLDVLVVRKIGHPQHREFAVGAIAERGVAVFDESLLGPNPGARPEIAEVIAEETQRLNEYGAKFHFPGIPNLKGKSVLLVDDGLATGATTEAAVLSVRKQGARNVIVAAPVASIAAVGRLGRVADEVIVLIEDEDFEAVGRYYEIFTQTTDEEVLALLRNSTDTWHHN